MGLNEICLTFNLEAKYQMILQGTMLLQYGKPNG